MIIEPFIVNPNAYNKKFEFERSYDYIDKFMILNELEHPQELYLENPKTGRKWTDYGWYKFGSAEMFVNYTKSRTPPRSPGFSWSYPGYKSDLTGPGILAHEYGHRIHDIMINRDEHSQKDFMRAMRKIKVAEAPVSGYEPNSYEVFAEMMRIFILNPDFLRVGRPIRWGFITDILGIKPPHCCPWEEVLTYAHPRFISAAKSWIKKGN